MAQFDSSQLLNKIYIQRKTAPLSVLALAEPILTPEAERAHSQSQRQSQSQTQSDVSQQSDNALNPSQLKADLAHYKDLFSKLRFSYLEQVTKEKYLRGIVGEPPILATSEDNVALEDKLAIMKTDLQAKKRSVEALVVETENLAKEVAERYDSVQLAVQTLEVVPDEVQSLEEEVQTLQRELNERQGQEERSEDPRMNLSMEETERLLGEQRARNEDLRRQIEELERDMPERTRECERAERELEELEGRRNEITKIVRDAQKRKEQGGRDLLEEQGRWYKSNEVVLRALLGISAES